MGLIDTVRNMVIAPDAARRVAAIASPLHEGESHLEPIRMGDWIHDISIPSVSREQAIRVPALARARTLITSTIARLPLMTTDAQGDEVGPAPQFLTSHSGVMSPFHRMLWTVDDLFFYGWSLWAVSRDLRGNVIDAERIEYDRWTIDADGTVIVDDNLVHEDDVILIPGINAGILIEGADTLVQAMRLAHAAARAAENPSAQVELHQNTDRPLPDDDIDKLINKWARARRGENGGVAYTSSAIEVKEHGASSEHLLIEGRNAAAVDIARHAGLPATIIDATLSGSSLSYQNSAARLVELVTFGLAPLMNAVAGRLSQDDVTPPGQSVAFDTLEVIQQISELSSVSDSGSNEPSAPVNDPFDERTK